MLVHILFRTSSDEAQSHDQRALVGLQQIVDLVELEEPKKQAHFPHLLHVVSSVMEDLEKFQHATPDLEF